MRTAALLIFLVVVVSLGEALQCHFFKEPYAERVADCEPEYDVCMHFKNPLEELKSCEARENCENMEFSLTRPEDILKCCTEDFCNA
uniref:PMF Class III-like B variant 2 n=1 Tax=Plethodon cinereus TaxID=141976 RepID=W8QQ36_9SALA|nr:PMF Class III-like B variant 2 [Plethodon cinereus]